MQPAAATYNQLEIWTIKTFVKNLKYEISLDQRDKTYTIN